MCFAPVLNLIDAANHPHNKARNSYQTVGGMLQQSPAPRFSRTQAADIVPPRVPGEDTAAVLADYGFTEEEKAEYIRPFINPGEERRPTLTWPRQIPLEDEPSEVVEEVSKNAEFHNQHCGWTG